MLLLRNSSGVKTYCMEFLRSKPVSESFGFNSFSMEFVRGEKENLGLNRGGGGGGGI